MSSVVAIGESDELEGFALVGVTVQITETPETIDAAWSELDSDVGLVILSPAAAEALRSRLVERPDVLTVVMP